MGRLWVPGRPGRAGDLGTWEAGGLRRGQAREAHSAAYRNRAEATSIMVANAAG